MRIGVPKEIKDHEYRVGIVPGNVRELVQQGHQVFVETNAGLGIGFSDEDYTIMGARILNSVEDVFSEAELIVKVKEPQPEECKRLRPGQTLFTFLHLAPDPVQAELLLASGCSAVAYETVTDNKGRLPLLTPMSEVAGKMAVQAGATALEKSSGGRGVLLGGVPGVLPADVVIIGGGAAGANAARTALGMEARVTILDKSIPRLTELDWYFKGEVRTIYATQDAIEHAVMEADLVIGAVLVPGASAPKLINRDHLSQMRKGAALVDISIDQGGCFETSKPTTHSNPTYIVDGIVHYCVTNIPGAVARTATFALNNATMPYITALAGKGLHKALREDPHLMAGLNVHHGAITYAAVAEALGYPYTAPMSVVGN
ncbi:MAG: alanine dehydrogenase [Gammaproteobacteria bacterium]